MTVHCLLVKEKVHFFYIFHFLFIYLIFFRIRFLIFLEKFYASVAGEKPLIRTAIKPKEEEEVGTQKAKKPNLKRKKRS